MKEIGDNGVVITNENGDEETIFADLLLNAFGYKAYNPLEEIASLYIKDYILWT